MIGCYDGIADEHILDAVFQYPLSGLDRLLPIGPPYVSPYNVSFNTLCRVLIGCYLRDADMRQAKLRSFNTLCRVLIGCYIV